MSSDAKDIKTNQAETVGNESVGDKLGYDKDSKEQIGRASCRERV